MCNIPFVRIKIGRVLNDVEIWSDGGRNNSIILRRNLLVKRNDEFKKKKNLGRMIYESIEIEEE